MIKFSKNFRIGGSISAIQTEGIGITKRGKLAFDTYFEEKPELFFENQGPDVTCDMTRHYVEDIKMFKQIGLDSIRTSFSWARLFPDGKTLDPAAVEFYHRYIKEYKVNGIELCMTLFHFDMPMWAQEKDGWASREVINDFVKYAKFVFEEFGDEVDCYVTFNEPLVPVFEGYLGDRHYPAINDPKRAVAQAFGIFLAHARVVEEFRKHPKLKAKIGMDYNWNYTYPFSNSEADIEAAKIHDAYVNRGPLEIMFNGKISPLLVKTLKEYDLIPFHTKEELMIISQTKVDFLGINYYFPSRAKAKLSSNPRWALDNLVLEVPANAKFNPYRGWEIYPEGIYDIGMSIKNELGNIDWCIYESGMGVENEQRFRNSFGFIDDDYRIEYLNDHLLALKKAIDQGSNCFGYHLWAPIDCWSFRNGFKNRYGLIELDVKTQARKFKKSAYWYHQLILNRED